MTLSTVLIHYGKSVVNVYILKAVLVLCVIPMIQFVLNKKITYRDFSSGDTALILIPAWQQKSFLQKFFFLFLLLSAVMWVIIPSTYHSTLHFDPAETLMWGSTFNLGSAKHPPMSGYMLYHFCKLFNFHNSAIFLLSQLCVTIGFIYIYKLARCFFDRDHSVMAVLLITFYFFYNYETPKFNANIPHVLFIPMMLYYFYRGCQADKWHHWIGLALSGAAAFSSKYSAGVLAVSFLIYLIVDKNARKVLFSIKPYLAAVIFAAVMFPHMMHLVKTDFLVFNYINHGKAVKYSYPVQLVVLIGALLVPLLCMSLAALATYWLGNRKISIPELKISNPAAAKYAGCIIGGQAAFLLFMGICGHRLLTIWTFPLFLPAGILIMSFYPLPANEHSKKIFAVLAAVFGALLLLIPLIYYNVSTKYRYHISKADLRQAAEFFCLEETGSKDIPFITGEIWHASMLQNTFSYRVKACPDSDPILLGLHRDKIESDGALVINGSPENLRKFFAIEIKMHKRNIEYRSRFGKKKIHTCYFGMIPPGSKMIQKDK